eukprot:CAMPEP_0117438472 /NCGR_PEP_ID=MMETSP0759-20121206/2071_1 /TAXON_ID=63605 /ORGANISM="Percolomonas cosmopolitus, Strain WS" /LENGTH=432 /DNA_ID=CAMNT_0005230165 /DNA_START=230 /DNA_END=1528 /DNA_ORIENTATION=+
MTFIDGCLALTIFRAEMDKSILFMFVLLNVFKVFHWIAEMRVKLMETENASRRDITSVIMVSLTFCILDAYCISTLWRNITENGVSVKILFLTEYMILCACMFGIVARVLLYFWYRVTNTPWTNRGSSLFYLEIVVDLVQSVIYIIFFVVTMIHYSLPLHLIHDLFVTLTSVWKRIHDVYNYRKLAAHFDHRLPNATQDQLDNAERCMICFESMDEAKVLHCNHLFHAGCLRRWLETSLECPMCRSPVNLDVQVPQPQDAPVAAAPQQQTAPQGEQQAHQQEEHNHAHNNNDERPQLRDNALLVRELRDMMREWTEARIREQGTDAPQDTQEEQHGSDTETTGTPTTITTTTNPSTVSSNEERSFTSNEENNKEESSPLHTAVDSSNETKLRREVMRLQSEKRELMRLCRSFVEKQRGDLLEFSEQLRKIES